MCVIRIIRMIRIMGIIRIIRIKRMMRIIRVICISCVQGGVWGGGAGITEFPQNGRILHPRNAPRVRKWVRTRDMCEIIEFYLSQGWGRAADPPNHQNDEIALSESGPRFHPWVVPLGELPSRSLPAGQIEFFAA
jgi:hypothetical protein